MQFLPHLQVFLMVVSDDSLPEQPDRAKHENGSDNQRAV